MMMIMIIIIIIIIIIYNMKMSFKSASYPLRVRAHKVNS